MDIFTLMESKKNSFSKTDHLIYNSIRKFPDDYASLSINKIIERRDFSQPSLTRFAKKLGFSGFNEFQYQFRRDLFENPSRENGKSRPEIYADQLLLVARTLPDDVIDEIADRFMTSSCVYLFGTSLSRMPADFIVEAMRIIGVRNVQLLPADASAVPYRKEDLFLCFSAHSGRWCIDTVNKMAQSEERPYSILVTMSPKHPLRGKFDQVIAFPEAPSSGNARMILNDTMAFMMFTDLLLNSVSLKMIRS